MSSILIARKYCLILVTGRSALGRLGSQIQVLYNEADTDGLYALLDPVAQAQLTKPEFEEQLGGISSMLGEIESVAYSHFEKTNYGQDDVYILHYVARLSNGQFDRGTLKVTAIDRGDHFRLLGFNLWGGTGPQ